MINGSSGTKVEVLINAVNDHRDPSRIAITFKIGRKTLARVEMDPADFGLATTGRLVYGALIRTDVITHDVLSKLVPEPHLAKQE